MVMLTPNEFWNAAFPWIALGILLAVLIAKASLLKNSEVKREDYGSEGMCIGMCLGTALSTAIHVNVGIGLSLGMLAGLVIGSSIEKTNE